jgi:hypothetical protein
MSSDIITSAPRPEDLPPPIAPEAPEAPEARRRSGARGSSPAGSPDARPGWRGALESLAETLIRSIAAAPPVRALEAFVDRRLAAEDAKQQAAEAAAAAHAMRVYAQLTEGEQRMIDDLLRGGALDDVLATAVRRSEDEALDLLRRRLGAIEPVVTAASLARQVGRVRGRLTSEEYDRVILRLPHLSSDEQQALHTHLCAMTPDDAAMLLRSYLRPGRH